MKKIIFFSACLFVAGNCFAQASKTDSLKQAMESYTKKDTIRVQKILRYSGALNNSNPKKAIDLKKEALDLSKNIKWEKGIVFSLLSLANISADENNLNQSITYSMQALNVAEDIGNLKLIADSHSMLSEAYRLSGDESRAETHALKYLEMARLMKNDTIIAQAEVMLVEDYVENGKWNKADSLFPSAMALATTQKNEFMINRLLWDKAIILDHEGKFKESIKTVEKSLPYYLKLHRYHSIAYSYSWLSNSFTKIKEKDSAFFYAKTALELAKKLDLKKEFGDANRAFFNYYYGFGNYKKALEYKTIYDSIQDETFKWASAQNIKQARLQIEQEKKDASVKAVEIKKEAAAMRLRNIELTVIAAFVLLAVFLFWNNRRNQKARAKIEAAYSELKSTQKQLIQSEKMASLGELTAGIAHEIQNPLNFVNNFSEVNKELIEELKAERRKPKEERDEQSEEDILNDIEENAGKINHHGKRAGDIVKGMLQHSRVSSGVKEPTDINALCDEYLRLSYHGLRAKNKDFNATMKTDFDESIGKINIIPQDIGRVLLNIYNNAFYAVNEQKSKNLISYEPTVSVTTKKSENKVLITVSDNGNGIPQNILNKIFQPFFTTKPTGQGTGLGLSLSYDIVKAAGGEIKVETKESEGSTFIIVLPES
ncbi:MAG: ATP-binding protein [Ginsengibacter sp.]